MGLPYEFAAVSYPPSDAYRAMNPRGTVPLLEEDDPLLPVGARSREAIERAIEHVKTVLGSRTLAGSQLTLADISVDTALGIWRGAFGKTLPAELSAYQERMAARPALQRARKVKQG